MTFKSLKDEEARADIVRNDDIVTVEVVHIQVTAVARLSIWGSLRGRGQIPPEELKIRGLIRVGGALRGGCKVSAPE